jgi:succinyl-CoA synthetase beta subunit
MKLLEHQAHELFSSYGIPSAKGLTVSSVNELSSILDKISYPVVIKAQVQTGGRGKAGGVAVAHTQDELAEKAEAVLNLKIKGLPVKKIFLTNLVNVISEFYLSITIDRNSKLPIMIFSPSGGMDINEIADTDPTKIIRTFIEPFQGVQIHMIQYIFDSTGIDMKYFDQMYSIVQSLYKMFIECDCLLAEINPLVVDEKGLLLALDAKVEIDDNALIRHGNFKKLRDGLTSNNLILEARAWGFLYIPVGAEGSVGIISNGSGMIMSSIDLLSKRGVEVACALDLGGGATAERVKEAIRIVFHNNNVKLAFINIFGGITRCDEIANGISLALEENPTYIVVVRMEGTNKENGIQIIKRITHDVEVVPDLLAGVNRIQEKVAL